jgi:predicted signal transduction protein with EAL and GGDEF domain
VAARLSAAVRVADVVARLGGDEFVVLIEGHAASANAARVARKIELACALSFDIGSHRLKTAASIGIAIYPQDGADAQALMKNADTAMYHAKQEAAAPVQFFHEELNERERERSLWTQELRKALAGGQLELRYQPQVDSRSGLTVAAEALLYWRHPRHGVLEAAQFLPQVQERALLDRIDAWYQLSHRLCEPGGRNGGLRACADLGLRATLCHQPGLAAAACQRIPNAAGGRSAQSAACRPAP